MNSVFLTELESKLLHCEELCVSSPGKVKEFLIILRGMYNEFQKQTPFGPLDEIIIDGLDLEVTTIDLLACISTSSHSPSLQRVSGKSSRPGTNQ